MKQLLWMEAGNPIKNTNFDQLRIGSGLPGGPSVSLDLYLGSLND